MSERASLSNQSVQGQWTSRETVIQLTGHDPNILQINRNMQGEGGAGKCIAK